MSDAILRRAFVALIALAPLSLGSNRPIPWTVLALAVAGLLLAWSLLAALRPAGAVAPPERLWPALAGLGLVVAVVLLQIAPLTPRAWHHTLWLQAAAVLGGDVGGRISVNPHETGTALMRLLSYGGVFWLALQLSRQPDGARRIVQAIALAGLAYAAYGLLLFLLDLKLVLWWRKWHGVPGITSTFVNRNSYATYAGLGLLCAVGLLITGVYRDVHSRRLRRLPWRVRLMRITWRGWWLVGAVICLSFALILTQSRAGVASSAAGLAVLVASFGLTRLMRRRDVLITAGIALLLSVAVFALGGDDLANRFERKGLESESRFLTYQRISEAIVEAPWLGTGYGTFPEVFRGYQGGVTDAFWNHAHNSYLENALELGIPAAAALTGAIAWLAYGCARGLRQRRRNALYPCLGLAATTLVGLHSLLDFSLEIPAIAVTYAAILGVAYGRTQRATGGGRRAAPLAWPDPRHRLAPGLAMLTAIGILALGVPRLAAQHAGLPARVVERQLLESRQTPRPDAADRAIRAGKTAAAWADAGENWWRVARIELALAEQRGLVPNARRSRLERADEAFRQALTHAPANPVGWAQLAYVTLLRDADPADLNAALTLSVLTGPSLGGVMALRSGVAALAWERLDARTRAMFRPQFAKTMHFAPQQFVEAIRRSDGVQVVRAELDDDPVLRGELERLLLIMGQR